MTDRPHRHTTGERRPVEVLVFQVDPADVEAFLAADHEVWTLGEADSIDGADLPFLSKEVWLNDNRPGEITIVFVWPDQATWDAVGAGAIQSRLTEQFERRFTRPYELVREIHLEEDRGLHRWSRFARPE
ncbi:MAG: TIGR03792 family protein [Actinomycetota bacterium]